MLASVDRLTIMTFLFAAVGGVVVLRLALLQTLVTTRSLGDQADQRQRLQALLPRRGEIAIVDDHAKRETPIAFGQTISTVFAVPNEIEQKQEVAKELSAMLHLDEKEIAQKLERTESQFVPFAKRLPPETVDAIKAHKWKGIYFQDAPGRVYPDGALLSQVSGFVRTQDNGEMTGQYGIEEFFNKELTGHSGWEHLLRDGTGRLIPLPGSNSEKAQNGLTIVLTIDRTVQFQVCSALERKVAAFQASGGSAVVMNPRTGEIRALCNVPSFDPNKYADVKNIRDFSNAAIIEAYEPGSVMKIFTMAAGIEYGEVTPETTFVDTGSLTFGPFTIRNAADKVYGLQTMVGVLKDSINTGAVFVAQKVGSERFRSFLERLEFGAPTGVELPNEQGGSLRSLRQPGAIYTATASFGQGISVTLIQLARALSAVANGGTLISPTIIKEFRTPSGLVLTPPIQKRSTVMSRTTSTLISGMMAQVVEEGHSKGAAVPGYYIAGKTGTAQVAIPGQRGYSGKYNHTFMGFGPVENPQFLIVVRIVNPKALYAESTAVPVAGEIEKFLISYDRIPPTRTIGQ